MNFAKKLIGSVIISIILLIISAENIVFKQQCNSYSIYDLNICPEWTTSSIVSVGLFLFSLIFISTYIIWSLIQKTNYNPRKKNIAQSIIISLIFFNLNSFITISEILGRLGIDNFSRKIELSISDFYGSVFSSLVFIIPFYIVLCFIIYTFLRLIKKYKFLEMSFKKLILTLIIIFPIIFRLSSVFLKLKLLPTKFSFLNEWIIISDKTMEPFKIIFYVFGGPSFNASFTFFTQVFAFLFLTFVYYILSSFIIFYWDKVFKKITN